MSINLVSNLYIFCLKLNIPQGENCVFNMRKVYMNIKRV